MGGRWAAALAAGVLAVVSFAAAAAPASGATFEKGDLIVSSSSGAQWLRGDGSFVQALAGGPSFPVGMASFDPSGRLWFTNLGNRVDAYDSTGAPLGPVVDPFNPEGCGEAVDIAFDAKGNAFVGDFGGCSGHEGYGAKKFSPAGEFLSVAVAQESDGVDLAADQCTLFWQDANGESIWRRNTCVADSPIEYVFSPCQGLESQGMRILPDGSLLSAEQALDVVVRVDSTAAPIWTCRPFLQTYGAPGCERWLGVTLNEDGTAFWSTCVASASPPTPYEFDVASGQVLRVLGTEGVVRAVYGGFRAAQDRTPPTVSLQTPTQGASYTLGEPVAADYACADAGGSEVASCAGTVPDGNQIDTGSAGTKTFTVTATDGAGNTTSTSVTYQVVPPALTIADASVTEGSPATFVVTLSPAVTVPVAVAFATSNGSARVVADYGRTVGTLRFGPGETSKTIVVPTASEALFELDETFFVNLANPTNATLADGRGVGTIVNDDPMPSVTIGDVSRLEGAAGTTSQLVFTVTLSAVSGVVSRMRFATANRTAVARSDYGPRSGTLSIAAGRTTGTIAVTITGDGTLEPDETFALLLSAPLNVTVADGEAIGTILNDD